MMPLHVCITHHKWTSSSTPAEDGLEEEKSLVLVSSVGMDECCDLSTGRRRDRVPA